MEIKVYFPDFETLMCGEEKGLVMKVPPHMVIAFVDRDIGFGSSETLFVGATIILVN